MHKALSFLANHWYVPLVFVGSIVLFMLTAGRKANPVKTAQRELRVIKAGAEASKARAELGSVKAIEIVESKYRRDLAALEGEQAAAADLLRGDPAALARFIVRGKS